MDTSEKHVLTPPRISNILDWECTKTNPVILVVQGESLARVPKLLSIKYYGIEIMT